MKLNNNYVRQALISVAENNTENYTILTLADQITKNMNKDEYISAAYAINVMLGELLMPAIQQNNYPYDENTRIVGLTKKGSRLYKSVRDDALWNETCKRRELLGSSSFESMAYCCAYLNVVRD